MQKAVSARQYVAKILFDGLPRSWALADAESVIEESEASMTLLYDFFYWYFVLSSFTALLVLLWGWANGRQRHRQPVLGPFRANVRRVR